MKSDDRREFAAILAIAEDSYGFPVDHWLDEIFAVQEYLFGGQAELDQLIEEVEIGEKNPKELIYILNNVKRRVL